MKDQKITFCPACKNPVEDTEYFSRNGLSDWHVASMGIRISCSHCRYVGLPVQLDLHSYQKLKRSEKS